jgi:hypothetical protein
MTTKHKQQFFGRDPDGSLYLTAAAAIPFLTLDSADFCRAIDEGFEIDFELLRDYPPEGSGIVEVIAAIDRRSGSVSLRQGGAR